VQDAGGRAWVTHGAHAHVPSTPKVPHDRPLWGSRVEQWERRGLCTWQWAQIKLGISKMIKENLDEYVVIFLLFKK
jgi:hypothetical protein